jgi:AAA family ATP:ADP antiporter
MKDGWFTFPGVESGEKSKFSLLLAQSVFLGIFIGAFDISAHSIFLSVFDEKLLARGYAASGLTGIILTLIYTRLQKRFPFRNLAILNLAFITVVTFILWILLLLKPSESRIFLLLVLFGPMNILALLGFRDTSLRLFPTQNGNKSANMTDAGLIAGIIISCFAIPLLLSLNFRLHNIIAIGAAAILAGSIIQILIGKRFPVSDANSGTQSPDSLSGNQIFSLFRKDQYLRITGLFIGLSVMSAFLIQYSFLAVTRVQYPDGGNMAQFLGLFTGSTLIVAVLIRLLLFNYFIRNYGLRANLAISPLIISGLTLIALVAGLIMGYGPATGGFMFLFIMLALSRLFSRSLRDSFEFSSLKIIYQTTSSNVSHEVRQTMEGTLNEVAAFFSGLVLTAIGLISFIKLVHFSIVLFVITILWVFAALRLYAGYRASLWKAIERSRQKQPKIGPAMKIIVCDNEFSAGLAFKNEYFNLVNGDKTGLERNRNELFYNTILDHSQINKDISLLHVIKSIASDKDADKAIRQRSAGLAEIFELLKTSDQLGDDKILDARILLSGSRQPQTTQILRLLRDKAVESKKLAILMIGKFRLTDMIPDVCDCLNIRGLEVHAENVLKNFGSEADEALGRYYLTVSGNTDISRSVLRLLGESCRKENMGFLFSRLWSYSRQIKETAISCLTACNYKAADGDKERLIQLISDITGIISWNLNAGITLHRKGNTPVLEALNNETGRWYNFLFGLLSITYDSSAVNMIRENHKRSTIESVNNTLEIADIVFDESIKTKLIPLIDIKSDGYKIKRLHHFYPVEIYDQDTLSEIIINRDYNLLGIWIRACVLRGLAEIKNGNMAESIIALLFSPEKILREESARLIARSDSGLFRTASARIPEQHKGRLNEIMESRIPDNEMLFEKVAFLSECLKDTDEENLLFLADNMIYMKEWSEDLPGRDGFILWSVGQPDTESKVEIIFDLQRADQKDFNIAGYNYFYLLPLKRIEEYIYNYPELSSEIMKYISKYGVDK